MKKKLPLFLIVVLAFLIGSVIYMKCFHTPQTILKTAVKETNLTDVQYILCKRAVTTGFDWLMIKDENGKEVRKYCNIIGKSPFKELNLNDEFIIADNVFVFYIEEKNMVYSEVTKQDEIEYVITGWDILYPIKHSDFFVFNLFRSKKYITEKDLSGLKK